VTENSAPLHALKTVKFSSIDGRPPAILIELSTKTGGNYNFLVTKVMAAVLAKSLQKVVNECPGDESPAERSG
jgi:hypothetical protein